MTVNVLLKDGENVEFSNVNFIYGFTRFNRRWLKIVTHDKTYVLAEEFIKTTEVFRRIKDE